MSHTSLENITSHTILSCPKYDVFELFLRSGKEKDLHFRPKVGLNTLLHSMIMMSSHESSGFLSFFYRDMGLQHNDTAIS
jgi:hypothetical protein